ncbi:MAG: NAD(P)(+) transhydrogenase (Re/Si-specific) subunit beta, partial [Verrucomicrobiota bacterium]
MDFENFGYIAASILFILGIKMLGSAETAKRGNRLSSVGMLVAVLSVIGGLAAEGKVAWHWVFLGLGVGGLIGFFAAKKVEMTGMPELVALFNGFGGLASLFVGWAEVLSAGGELEAFTGGSVVAAILIGGITFTGSLIAYLKLSGKMGGAPTVFPAQKLINGTVLVALLLCGLGWISMGGDPILLLAIIILSLALGVLGVIPIGGGDMPVVIAFLNSCSGLAAAAAGFVILNNVLIVAGCLVGTSGLILTIIMCKAMNRTLSNVFFGGFGASTGKTTQVEGEMKALSVEDAYYVLEAAKHVIFVPGYGMAVAQAQHAVKELA